MENIEKLGSLFSEIVKNDSTFAASWRNIELGKEAFELMKDGLPLRVEGELTPYTRAVLLEKMVDCLPERDCARFILSVREYQKEMLSLAGDEDLEEDMEMDEYEGDPSDYVRQYTLTDVKQRNKRLEDYIDPKVTMEDWCREYGVHLKFDPVEMTGEWEEVIYDVESECDRLLKDENKGMGYCYSYWSTKRSVLAKHGIEWSSPAAMNPRVMFD